MKLRLKHEFHRRKSEIKAMKKQINSQLTRMLVVACTILLMLCVAQIAFAQQPTSSHPQMNQQVTSAVATSSAANAAAKTAAAPSEPASEGIKVHGHWVLDVKNPDGKLVEHREFNNALVKGGVATGGDQILAALISGNVSVGDPSVAFVQTIPAGSTDVSSYCYIQLGILDTNCYLLTTSQSMTIGFAYTSTGLTTTLSFTPNVSWVLSGNYT